MANRITCQHDPLIPGCSMVVQSNLWGHRIFCESCDTGAVITKGGHIKPPPQPSLETALEYGTNTGHGHVWPRPDGVKARCGGPGLCAQCSRDEARLGAAQDRAKKQV